MKYHVLDNIMSKAQIFKLYNILISTPNWTLDRSSSIESHVESTGFPGMIVEENGNSRNTYLSGYFHSMLDTIKLKFIEKYEFDLPHNVHRIHLGAKNSKSETAFHQDTSEVSWWTILGFLTPVWKLEDGGEFKIEGETIDYKPGRFIIFRSNLLHDGGYVRSNNLDYWRISLNIMLTNK